MFKFWLIIAHSNPARWADLVSFAVSLDLQAGEFNLVGQLTDYFWTMAVKMSSRWNPREQLFLLPNIHSWNLPRNEKIRFCWRLRFSLENEFPSIRLKSRIIFIFFFLRFKPESLKALRTEPPQQISRNNNFRILLVIYCIAFRVAALGYKSLSVRKRHTNFLLGEKNNRSFLNLKFGKKNCKNKSEEGKISVQLW